MWFILFILIIVIAIFLYRRRKRKFTITPDAKSLFTNYISSHELVRNRESKCSGLPDITADINKYFEIELQEKDHADVLEAIIRDNGEFDAPKMQRWIDENYDEIYKRGELECEEGLPGAKK